MIDHDPKFPFALVSTIIPNHVIAKFRGRADASFAVETTNWTTRIVDTTPKPLPTEPGIYVREGTDLTNAGRLSTAFYILSEEGTWLSDASDTLLVIGESEVPTDLVPLVKGTRG